jgi:hypothetical protein
MQIIYAAPFVLISVIAFAVFGAVPRLRRHAIAALVAPAPANYEARLTSGERVMLSRFIVTP